MMKGVAIPVIILLVHSNKTMFLATILILSGLIHFLTYVFFHFKFDKQGLL